MDEGIQNPAICQDIEEIHFSIFQKVNGCVDLVRKYIFLYSLLSISSKLLMYGISDDMTYFDSQNRKNKGMKLLCRGADLPLHGYIPLLEQKLRSRVQNMI